MLSGLLWMQVPFNHPVFSLYLMPHRSGCSLLFVWLTLSCFANAPLQAQSRHNINIKTDNLSLVDPARNRQVPVVIYTDTSQPARKLKPAILSHCYGGKNTEYDFIASYLATHGYYVASIQHEVSGDEPLPTVGKPYETRMPSWKRGVQNILFVVDQLKKMHPSLDYKQLLLVGHSHGGDTNMLFAQEHPALVHTVISLDNRRMPIPRAKQPRLFSLLSSDQPADEGVLPSPEEQTRAIPKSIEDEVG